MFRRREQLGRLALLLLLSIALVAVGGARATAAAPAAANTAPGADDDAGGSEGQAGRYPLMARLAPCLPLPVHSNCSQVPATLQHNLLTCTHVSFQPGGYGQGARSARLAYEVEAEGDAAGSREEDGGLTMVLLVGSTLWFEDQAAMWDVLQPKLAAALQQSHGYDPTLQGPCMGGRQDSAGTGAGAITAVGRRRVRRRLLRGPGQQQEEEGEQKGEEVAPDAAAGQEQQQERQQEDGGAVPSSPPAAALEPAAAAAAVPAVPVAAMGSGLPSCAEMAAAFNAADDLGGAASPFAFLYTCNVTSTAREDPASSSSNGGGSSSQPQVLAYDGLDPDAYPFTYFVFINANVAPADGDNGDDPTAATAAALQQLQERAVNQTVRYAASFTPTYAPTPASLPQPAFALLLIFCAFAFLVTSACFSAPLLDWLATTRCGKRCLRARV